MGIIPSSKGIIYGPLRFKFVCNPTGKLEIIMTVKILKYYNDIEPWIECDYSINPTGVLIDHRWASTSTDSILIELQDPVRNNHSFTLCDTYIIYNLSENRIHSGY